MSTSAAAAPSSTPATTNLHSTPTSEYLRARASALTRIMLTSFEDILSIGHDDTSSSSNPPSPSGGTDTTTSVSSHFDQSLVNTAARQAAVNVATGKIVRAAEEYLVLTRRMKEVWVLGGLDTLVADADGEDGVEEGVEERKRRREQQIEDERVVVEGLRRWAGVIGEGLSRDAKRGDAEGEEVGGDGAAGTPMSTG